MSKKREPKISDLEIMQDSRFATSSIVKIDGKEIVVLECHLYLRGGDIPVAKITIPIRSVKVKCKAKIEKKGK